MKKKQYIIPALSIYQVNTCMVICGSGDENATIVSGSYTDPGWGNGKPIISDAAQRRNGWDEYENL